MKEPKWVVALVAALILSVAVLQAESADDGTAGGTVQGPPTSSIAAHQLLDLNVDSTVPGRTQITLSVDAQVEYETLVLDSPDRLVLDLKGVVSQLDDYKFDVEQSGVVRVRAAQYRRDPIPVARVVFDLEEPLAYVIDRQGTDLIVAFGPSPMQADREEMPAEPTLIEAPIEIGLGGTDQPMPAPLNDGPVLTPVSQIVEEMEARYDELAAEESPDVEPFDFAELETSRVVESDLIERLVQGPPLAAPSSSAAPDIPTSFETKRITADAIEYSGQEISLNLVDADIKQIFRLFHEISGLNFVLDPGVSGRVTVVLDHVPWDQALDIILRNNGLDKELERNVIRIAATTKLAKEAAARRQLKDAAELEVELVTITRTLSYAKAKDLEQTFRAGGGGGGGRGGLLSPRGRVIRGRADEYADHHRHSREGRGDGGPDNDAGCRDPAGHDRGANRRDLSRLCP